MDYQTWKILKRRLIAILSVVASLMLGSSLVLCYWTVLTVPPHRYIPQMGEYIGPTNISEIQLGIFTTSEGPYGSLFSKPDKEETQKINIVAAFLLLSTLCSFIAGVTKVLAPLYCRVAKRYKASALLNVLAVVLNVGGLVIWFWFSHGFTHGRYALGALIRYGGCVYTMLASCAILILVIALDFISCKRRSRSLIMAESDYPISPTASDTSDVPPVNLSPDDPPPYQPLE